MTRSESCTRRTFLRGVGGTAVALPALVGAERAHGTVSVPERLITVFFGLGLPDELSRSGLTGALAPLAPYANRLTMVRGIEARSRGSRGNGHTRGCAAFACGWDYETVASKGGPSLDWVVQQHAQPGTPLLTLSAGVYGGANAHERMRIVHSWRGKHQPNEPIADTKKLFSHIFGDSAAARASEAQGREARLRVSVLDSVRSEYQSIASARSPYTPGTRRVISNHLEHVRELERRAIQLSEDPGLFGCQEPSEVYDTSVLSATRTSHWDKAWPTVRDLYVSALRCDLVRFGNMMILSGGDKLPYITQDRHLEDVHALGYHQWPFAEATATRETVFWVMTKIASFLKALDDPEFLDANGGSLLDNATLLVGTELGQPAAHQRNNMTFLIAGGKGRFRPGDFAFRQRTDVDLYNTLTRALGLTDPFGDPRYFSETLPIIG